MSSKQNLARRGFILFGGALALTSMTAPSSLANALMELEVLPSCTANFSNADHLCLRSFGLQDFTQLLGQNFLVGAGIHKVHMQLTNATSHARDADPRPATVRREPFSLQFSAQQGLQLPAEIYDVKHPKLGDMKVFMTQIGDQNSDKSQYEVVFG
ncbi:hypothetical protein H8K33_11585 [Undibacterium amnicola]|uniref:DUF6916 domain-containing protein n=1 Tax=Undibacterium amnicola TaxID=1834038 RepID=A0ABR6XRN6_9BURK|nr:hypothetical protein [Undibacterium amnicola]MBC3832155.1 hypothetical protein [Undibacterium amnicola]